jgi:hypothetical protein
MTGSRKGKVTSRQDAAAAEHNRGGLGGGLGTEDALEARADEMDADYFFAVGEWFADMHDAALGFEVGFVAACGYRLQRDADLQAGADGDVEAGAKGGTATAEIFAGGFFLEGESMRVAASNT